MVDFAQHLSRPILTGIFLALIKPTHNGNHYYRSCEWKISVYASISKGGWISFKITKGGVTGHESFIIHDDRGFNHHMLKRIFITDPDGIWCANAGGMGLDAMVVNNKVLREAIQAWLRREGLTYPGQG